MRVELIYHNVVLERYMDLYGKRVVRLNGEEVKRSDITSRFLAVYSIGRENLIDGPQHERRKILDKLSGVVIPEYREYLAKYQRVVSIKKNAIFAGDMNTVIASNVKLWELYRKISRARENTLLYLKRIVEEEGLGKIEFSYRKSISGYDDLNSYAKQEIDEGKMLVGLNMDRVDVTVDGLDARSYYSHGIKTYIWQRILIKYITMVAEESGRTIFLLMDEPFAVLDEEKSQDLLENTDENVGQVVYFFTTQRSLNIGTYSINLDHGRIKADV